jgi:hypothetical protein
MPPAHPRGPNDPSFLRFLLEVLDSEVRVRHLTKLIRVVITSVAVAGFTFVAILSVYYLDTQHFPLWSRYAVPGGGIGISVVYGALRGRRGR